MTSQWQVVARLPQEVDLQGFQGLLLYKGVRHRIFEEGREQVIEAPSTEVEAVRELLVAWGRGEEPGYQVEVLPRRRQQAFAPLTLVLIGLSLCGALLTTRLVPLEFLFQFTYFGVQLQNGLLMPDPELNPWQSGQLWRLLTPMFIHMGLLHVVFNSLWLWELGGRIERWRSATYLLNLVLGIALFSNIAQGLAYPGGLFGGMSGVIFGLLGYIWIRQLLAPSPALAINPGIVVFMLVFLLLGFSGLLDVFVGGKISNVGHLSGLIAGCLAGAVSGWRARRV